MRGADGAALSVLVVEDEHAVAELVRTLLGQLAGWRATVVHDAPAAREVFRHVPIDALLVDVNLPGISGPELLELLRRDPTWDEPPVVLMSADADQPEIRAALRRGVAARFIPKPFDADHLVEEIRSAVAGRQEQGGARTAESSPGAGPRQPRAVGGPMPHPRRCAVCGAGYDAGRVERADHAALNARAGGTPSPARPDLPGRLLTLRCRSCGGDFSWDHFAGQRMVAGVHG